MKEWNMHAADISSSCKSNNDFASVTESRRTYRPTSAAVEPVWPVACVERRNIQAHVCENISPPKSSQASWSCCWTVRMETSSPDSVHEATKITPEVLQEMLQYYNLSRQEFIDTYNIQPLVYIPELPSSAKTVFVIMYTVIFVMALAGNSLVIYIILKKRAIQTATDIFICSLAVSDLLITFFCIPFTLLQNISSEWFGGEFSPSLGLQYLLNINIIGSSIMQNTYIN